MLCCRSVFLECGPLVMTALVMWSAVVTCWDFSCVSRGVVVQCGGSGVVRRGVLLCCMWCRWCELLCGIVS